ncbi:MAG: PDZ domain-containing protein [Deltaproteobacteria bacterium]|nr:PDZ domain-containing protein [Deltaproteobacteria bacterium]
MAPRWVVAAAAALAWLASTVALHAWSVAPDPPSDAPRPLTQTDSAADPPFEGERRAAALRDLGQMRVASRALALLRQRYVDPDKFRPREMVEVALQAVAHLVPEMLVDTIATGAKEEPLEVQVRIGAAQLDLDLRRCDDLYAVNWHLLRASRFVAERLPASVSAEKVQYTALNGVLSTLDPYSRLLDPDQWRDMQSTTGGNFGGLGIVILPVDGVLTVQSVLPDSPAAKAGMQPGDRITQIDGEDTVNMTVDAAVERLRGEVGTTARLVLFRKGWEKPQPLHVVRAVIHLQSVESKVLDNGVGYAKIKNFQRGTAAELGEAIDDLLRAGAHRTVVLDLRDNPGGLLDEAVRVCDLFIQSGPAVTTVTGGQARDVRLVTGNGRFVQMPLAVLVNGHSASASEILAGALKYSGRAIVVGEQTFGKGSVQVPFEIEDGALKLTIAKYLVPGDLSIHGKGIAPDIGVAFVSATREQVSLFGGPKYSRATRKARLALEAQPPAPPKIGLKVLLPDGSERSEPDAETPAEVMDREPRQRAAAILRRVGHPEAARMLAAAAADVAQMARDDDAQLVAHLKRQGIDWRPGPVAVAPSLRVDIVEASKGLDAEAGEILRLAVTLTNQDKAPLHRLHVQTRCDDAAFDGHEQLVGRLEPGQSRTVPLSIRVSIRHGSLDVPLNVLAAQDGHLLAAQDAALLRVRGRPQPEFAFQLALEDTPIVGAAAGAAADGALQPGEAARLRVRVRNDGAGLAQTTVVKLRSLSGQRVHLAEGRARVGPLAPGGVGEAVVGVRGADLEPKGGGHRRADDWEPARLELTIADETLGVDRVQVVQLPWARKRLADAPPADRARLRGLLQSVWDEAPRVRVTGGEVTEGIGPGAHCWYTLRAEVQFDTAAPGSRFVTASVAGTKQFYEDGTGKVMLAVRPRLRLDPGLNLLSLVAQAGMRRSGDRTVLVHCAAKTK